MTQARPVGEPGLKGGVAAQVPRILGAGVALLLVSPANSYLAAAEQWLGSVALYAPVLGQLAGLALARVATGRWAWAAVLGVVGALPFLTRFFRPEEGAYAPVLLALYLALPALAGLAALIFDRRATPP